MTTRLHKEKWESSDKKTLCYFQLHEKLVYTEWVISLWYCVMLFSISQNKVDIVNDIFLDALLNEFSDNEFPD